MVVIGGIVIIEQVLERIAMHDVHRDALEALHSQCRPHDLCQLAVDISGLCPQGRNRAKHPQRGASNRIPRIYCLRRMDHSHCLCSPPPPEYRHTSRCRPLGCRSQGILMGPRRFHSSSTSGLQWQSFRQVWQTVSALGSQKGASPSRSQAASSPHLQPKSVQLSAPP